MARTSHSFIVCCLNDFFFGDTEEKMRKDACVFACVCEAGSLRIPSLLPFTLCVCTQPCFSVYKANA